MASQPKTNHHPAGVYKTKLAISRCIGLCRIHNKICQQNVGCLCIINYYLSNKKSLKLFHVRISQCVLPSRLLAFDRSVYHGHFCFSSSLIHPSKDACHDGLTVHTQMTTLYVSQSCQPSSPQRKTTASFI